VTIDGGSCSVRSDLAAEKTFASPVRIPVEEPGASKATQGWMSLFWVLNSFISELSA